jgi:hypothetical protein
VTLRWTAADERQIAARKKPPRDYLNITDLCRLYRITPAYAYKLASVHKWRRVRLHGLMWYLITDVEKWNLTRQ